jgi:hypothetical protein
VVDTGTTNSACEPAPDLYGDVTSVTSENENPAAVHLHAHRAELAAHARAGSRADLNMSEGFILATRSGNSRVSIGA